MKYKLTQQQKNLYFEIRKPFQLWHYRENFHSTPKIYIHQISAVEAFNKITSDPGKEIRI